jgi:hypothetical protein
MGLTNGGRASPPVLSIHEPLSFREAKRRGIRVLLGYANIQGIATEAGGFVDAKTV